MLRTKQQLSLNVHPKGRTSKPQQNVPGYFKKKCVYHSNLTLETVKIYI